MTTIDYLLQHSNAKRQVLVGAAYPSYGYGLGVASYGYGYPAATLGYGYPTYSGIVYGKK